MTNCLCEETEIDLLMFWGKLTIEITVELDSGLTFIQSKLGWIVRGKQNLNDNCTTPLSMHVRSIPLNELSFRNILSY